MELDFKKICVAEFAKKYWDNKSEAAKLLNDSVSLSPARTKIKTIATYYYRLYNGGAEKMVANLATLWVKMGYRVILFTDDDPTDDDYAIPNSVDRVVLPAGRAPAQYPNRAKVLEKALCDFEVDLFVYQAWINENAIWDAFAIKKQGIPFIMYTHNCSQIAQIYSQQYQYEMPYIYSLFDMVLSLSHVDEFYWSLFCKRSRYVINPVYFEREVRLASLDFSNIVWSGRLDPIKNYTDLPGIMEMVVREVPSAKLTVLGSADSRKELVQFKKQIAEKGLKENIILAGYQKNTEEFYFASSIFLMTSSFEGFPTVLTESKIHGLPCVTYDLPYLEMLRGGEGMIKVPLRDKRAAADAIIVLLKDTALRKKLGNDARESVDKYIDVDHVKMWQEIIFEMENANSANVVSQNPKYDVDFDTAMILVQTMRIYGKMVSDGEAIGRPAKGLRKFAKNIYYSRSIYPIASAIFGRK